MSPLEPGQVFHCICDSSMEYLIIFIVWALSRKSGVSAVGQMAQLAGMPYCFAWDAPHEVFFTEQVSYRVS